MKSDDTSYVTKMSLSLIFISESKGAIDSVIVDGQARV